MAINEQWKIINDSLPIGIILIPKKNVYDSDIYYINDNAKNLFIGKTIKTFLDLNNEISKIEIKQVCNPQ